MNDFFSIEISNGYSSSNMGMSLLGNSVQFARGGNSFEYARKANLKRDIIRTPEDSGENSFLNRLTVDVLKSFIDRKRSEALKYGEIFNLFEKIKTDKKSHTEELDQHTLQTAEYFMKNYVAALGLAAPKIKIFDDGELSFFWSDKSGDVDLTVESDETYSFYAKKKNEKKGIKGNYKINVTPPEQLLLMLK